MASSPPDISDPRFLPAEYRVRLFLSVDLSGSTAFKNSDAGEHRQDGPTPKWVTVFQQFYTDFPARFKTNYHNEKNEAVGNDGCPELWKAVGDELVFCGRITNKKSCAVALNSFINTLHQYREILHNDGINLNLKGTGWLAAFPEPNRAVQLRRTNEDPELLSASEALEKCADDKPFDYDFLGKAIDTGFRIAGTAKPERFVLSVQLARILADDPAKSGFGHSIRFARPKSLKGVNRDEPYPLLYIDTMKHLPNEHLHEKERQLLGEGSPPNRDEFASYLKCYCEVVGTDEIMLPDDAKGEETAPPESYTKHKEKIANYLLQEQDRGNGDDGDDDEAAQENGADIPEGESLIPLHDGDDK
ncbi:MAG TPA: hypothetical protein ENK34_06265 [Rhodobacteraceae bacterium]|nr:hypothetical protein [Paracoccaceae bacterium]